MKRLIIIDDSNCKDVLDKFLESNSCHILANSSFDNFQTDIKVLMEEAMQHIEKNKKIVISKDNNVFVVKTSDIIYIESVKNESNIYLTGGNHLEDTNSISKLAGKLNNDNFLKISTTCLVNGRYVTNISLGKEKYVEMIENKRLSFDKEGIRNIQKYFKNNNI
ncbi:MAG: LytTR family transcriptional regulator DNA-binding domain-containing protein [Bacteroidales bacterium]|nr:LytTR family transcriptional regulator DNA-binding domain-containing protein [Bacteroidales bacterium]